jgi:CHAT domain-containing protein/tetratricopeptide (TPR) repeat protein
MKMRDRLLRDGAIAAALMVATLHLDVAYAAVTSIDEVCSKVSRTNETLPRLHASFANAVRPDPHRALAYACEEHVHAATVDEHLRASVDVGQSLTYLSREDEAVAILDAAIEADLANRWDSTLRAELYLRRGKAWGELRDMKKAAPDFRMAHAILVKLQQQNSVIYAETLTGESAVLHEALDPDGAERAVDEAEAVLTRLGLQQTRFGGDILNQRTMIAYARQDFPSTLRYAEAEVALMKSIGGPDDREQLDALATVGALRSMTGDFIGAEAAQREGVRLTQVRDDTAFDARLGVLQNFSAFYLERYQPADALPLAEAALKLAQQHYEPGSVALFREYLTIGSVHAELLRYGEARDDFDKAAEIAAARGDALPVLSQLRFHLRKAQLDLSLGDLDESRAGLARADAVMGDQPKLGYWRGWGARIACKLDAIAHDWASADRDCERALGFLGPLLDPQHALILEPTAGRCIAQSLGQLPGDACAQIEERLKRASSINPKLRLLAYAAIATREQARGRGDLAFELRIKTLAIAEEIATPDPLWAADFSMAESLMERGNRPLAIFFSKRSVAAIEAMRDYLAADRQRLERGFLSDKLTVYRHLADWLLAERRAPEAIAVLRLLKREEMYDFGERGTSNASGTTSNDPQGRVTLSPQEERLARQIDALRVAGASSTVNDAATTSTEIERLIRLRDAKKITADELQRLQQLEALAHQREDMRAGEVRRFLAEQGQPMSIAQAREQAAPAAMRTTTLATDEADVYYFVNGDRLNLVFAWRGGITRTIIDIEPDRLARAIGDQLESMTTHGEPESRAGIDASGLYRLLGAPLDVEARKRGVKRVNLWLDGLLRYVPFAALSDGHGYLIERYEFVYRFGDGVDRATASETTSAVMSSPQLVAFGVTRALGGLPALPGVGDELCGIVKGPVSGLDGDNSVCASDGTGQGVLVGSAYANGWFTETRLRDTTVELERGTAMSPELLHLGTHFSLRPGNMQRSWLMLGDGARLPLARFSQLDFKGIDLVTLSACETAMAGAVGDDGREIEGLPALVHRRGAKSVVASLWRVDDRSASDLMRTFYAGLARAGSRTSDALRRAQLAMLKGKDEAHRRPYYWAAFVASTATR